MIRKRHKLFGFVLLLAFTVPGYDSLAQQSAPAPPTVLTGATLIDGTGRAAISDSVIVIEGDKFIIVGGKGPPTPRS
jgi:hypothetical protein